MQSRSSTSPPSPGKRRQLLRASKETAGEMTLEMYLYESDPFRCSSFSVPLPLPLKLEAPEPEFQIDSERMRPLKSNIRSILTSHSMEEDAKTVETALVLAPNNPGGEDRLLTLVIYMDQQFPHPSSWARARDELKAMFGANGLENIQIEIFDLERAFMPWLLPLSPSNDAIRHYETKREHLLSFVKESLSNDWSSMSLFGIRHGGSSPKPTLVIFVKAGTMRDWSEISSRLRAILSNPDIQIEFICQTGRRILKLGTYCEDIPKWDILEERSDELMAGLWGGRRRR